MMRTFKDSALGGGIISDSMRRNCTPRPSEGGYSVLRITTAYRLARAVGPEPYQVLYWETERHFAIIAKTTHRWAAEAIVRCKGLLAPDPTKPSRRRKRRGE